MNVHSYAFGDDFHAVDNGNEAFSITRRIEIDAAHRVPDHGSKCRSLHGHRYVIEATCQGTLHAAGEQKGMVLDFGFLKDAMVEVIHNPCDHGLILSEHDPLLKMLREQPSVWDTYGISKVVGVTDSPTAEVLARVWHAALEPLVEERSRGLAFLASLKVWETPNCFAVYPA